MSTDDTHAPNHELVQPLIKHGYLDGVALVANAVPDAFLFLDAPACGFEKIFAVAGTHDLLSDLYRVPTGHRVHCTRVEPDDLVHDRSDRLTGALRACLERGDWPAVMLASMPAVTITGLDYQSVVAEADDPAAPRIVAIREPEIGADWLEGYAEALLALSRQLPLEQGPIDPRAVAVVGVLYDRNEGDHRGNLTELRRACDAVGLELVSVWPGGQSTAELAAVGRAGTVLSLPYGRQAAAELARRTGAKLVVLDLPVGLKPTQRWVQTLGEIAGDPAAAESWCRSELERAVPLIDLVLEDHLLGRRFGYYGEPILGEALGAAVQSSAAVRPFAALSVREHAADALTNRTVIDEIPTLYSPTVSTLRSLDRSRLDFCVGTSDGHYLERIFDVRRPFVELGYPSYRYHCLRERPFFFFRGFVDLVNRLVNR